MENNRNLFLALAISFVILVGFHFVYEVPRQERLKQIQAQEEALNGTHTASQIGAKADTPAADVSVTARGPADEAVKPRAEALTGKRDPIENPQLQGSLALGGIRFDDLTFKNYYTAIDHKEHVDLLSPSGTETPYYASFGWLGDKGLNLPGDDTQWQGATAAIDPAHPATLTFDNGQGLVFTRSIALDDQYMFTITDHVTNHGTAPVTIYPYAAVARSGTPLPSGTGLEGAVAIANGTLKDASFMSMAHEPTMIAKLLGHSKFQDQSYDSDGGWARI